MPPFRRFLRILDAFGAAVPVGEMTGEIGPASPANRSKHEGSLQSNPAAPAPDGNRLGMCESESAIPEVRVGEEFVTPSGKRRLRIVRFAGQGTRGKVYQAIEIESARTCALKVIHEYAPVYLKSIAVEILKADVLAAHQLPFARIVETGDTYVLKEWIEGTPGDQWVGQWLEKGADPDDPAFAALIRFFHKASARGLHVDDLRPSNMLLRNGTEWVPIDTGPIHASVAPADAMRCYRERFIRRWLWVSRSPFWYVVYWTWCQVRGVDRKKQTRQAVPSSSARPVSPQDDVHR